MSRTEYITSVVLLVVLLCVAGAVVGYRLGAGAPATSLLGLLSDAPPAGWRRVGEIEEYPAYRLNEKINGEDIEFLSRGCLGLAWAAYVSENSEESFISVSLYDMAEKANAESIYESIRGPLSSEVKSLQLGDESYAVASSLFLRVGRYYVQVQAGASDPAVAAVCENLARGILERVQAAGQ